MGRLLADEDVPEPLCRHLRRLGHEVLSVRSLSRSKSGDGISDSAVFLEAQRLRAVLLIRNGADYRRLHGKMPGHHGMLVVKPNLDLRQQAKLFDERLRSGDRLTGCVVAANMLAKAARQVAEEKKPPKRRRRRS